jgi:hypothetical protein
VQTVIAPDEPEVHEQLEALPAKLREIAQRYIERLRIEPFLGHRLARGLLASQECRAVYFDRDSRPDDLFGSRKPPRRRGDQDATAGPQWRIVYRLFEAPRANVRVVQVLAVGRAHVARGEEDVYAAATRTLDRLDWRTR